MSYLLKALEKAEQERQQQPMQEQAPQTVVVQQSSLPKVFIFVALGMFGLVAYTVLKPSVPVTAHNELVDEIAEEELNTQSLASVSAQVKPNKAPETQAADVAPVTVIEPAAKTDTNSDQTETKGSNKLAVEEGSVVAADSVPAISPEPSPEPSVESSVEPAPLDLVELDTATLNALPTIRFQSHIYSSAADYRTVMINDRTLKEGMPISAKVRLKEITSTGVVIRVNEQLVALPKGQDWIAPQ